MNAGTPKSAPPLFRSVNPAQWCPGGSLIVTGRVPFADALRAVVVSPKRIEFRFVD